MRIFTKKTIATFVKKHANATVAIAEWYTKTNRANWNTFTDIKSTFNSVDYVGNDRFVFNLGGNKYRLVANVRFNIGRVFIRFIGTHAQYDKIVDKNRIRI